MAKYTFRYFPQDTVVVPPDPDPTEFLTPSDPVGWDSVVLTGTTWPLDVSSSTIPQISGAYQTLQAVVNDVHDFGPDAPSGVIVELPAGELGGTVPGGPGQVSYNPSSNGKNFMLKGQVKTVGDDTVYPDTGLWGVFIIDKTRTGGNFYLKNIRVGPTDAQLAADPSFQNVSGYVDFNVANRLDIINCFVRNTIGIAGLRSHEYDSWRGRRESEIWVWDSEIWGGGNNQLEHNTYIQATKLFAFIRSISRDSRSGHLIKNEGNKCVLLDSAFVSNTGVPGIGLPSNNSQFDFLQTQDTRVARNLFKVNKGAWGSVFKYTVQGTYSGGFSTKHPPVFDVEEGAVPGPPTSNILTILRASMVPPVCVDTGNNCFWHGSTVINAKVKWQSSAVAGSTSFIITKPKAWPGTRQGAWGTGDPDPNWKILEGVDYLFRVRQTDDSIFEFTGQVTALGGAQFEVSCPPVPVGISTLALVAMTQVIDGWDSDYLLLNSRYWNKADPNYWWDQIRDSGGELDLTKQDLFNTHYVEDNLIHIDRPAENNVFGVTALGASTGWGPEGGWVEYPKPPINKPSGATAEWPDGANYGSFAEPLEGDGYPYNGRNPVGYVSAQDIGPNCDWVWPTPIFMADNGVYKAPTNHPNYKFTNYNPWNQANQHIPDVRYIDAAGDYQSVGHAAADPMTNYGTELVGAHSSTDTTLTVDDITGFADGQKIMIELPLKRGSPTAIHITTVSGTPIGSTITIADGLARDAVDGASVVAFAVAGAKPGTWINPDEYLVK